MSVGRITAWLAGLLIAFVSFHARAESVKAQCVQANTDAQSLRRDGKLAAAREQLRFCSQSKCPGLVVADCVKRLDELDTAQPSVVFDVVDAFGAEVNDVTVSIDGKALLDKLTGAAVNVDLGEHELTFSAPGRPPVEQKVVFREGEKGRHLRVTLGAAPGSEPSAAAVVALTDATPVESEPTAATGGDVGTVAATGRDSKKTIGYAIGGVGVASLAAGGVFGILAIQAKQRQLDNCSTSVKCSNYDAAASAHNNAHTYGTISTVTFIAGAAATATGLVLVLTSKSNRENAAVTSVSVLPRVAPDQAGVAVSGAF
jgi:hypothetical protein